MRSGWFMSLATEHSSLYVDRLSLHKTRGGGGNNVCEVVCVGVWGGGGGRWCVRACGEEEEGTMCVRWCVRVCGEEEEGTMCVRWCVWACVCSYSGHACQTHPEGVFPKTPSGNSLLSELRVRVGLDSERSREEWVTLQCTLEGAVGELQGRLYIIPHDV